MRALVGWWSGSLITMALLAACEQPRDASPVDTTVVEPTLPPDTAALPATPRSAWIRSAGPILALPGGGPGDAIIVFPELSDTTLTETVRFAPSRAEGLALDLFDRSGLIGRDTVARMPAHEWTEGCLDWPAASLRGAPLHWTVGFVAGRVEPIPLDSIEAMPGQDSSALAATLTRLASSLADSSTSRFQGLPFRVRSAYRLPLGGGGQAVVADLVRRLTLEANPQEEHTMIIAESDTAGAPLRLVYQDRRAGAEETVEAVELLAAVRLDADRHPALVLVRLGYETTAYTLLERLGAGRWLTRWRSVTTGC
jgi:hypothetical protein